MSIMTDNQNQPIDQQNSQASTTKEDELTYGDLLREAREEKGLSIDQVASQLRLSSSQIEGLENCDPHAFSSPVYARAHLRSYAKLLGADEARIVNLYNSTPAGQDKENDQWLFINRNTSASVPHMAKNSKNGVGKLTVTVLFLAVLAAVGYMAYRYVDTSYDLSSLKEKIGGTSNETAPVSAPTTDLTNASTPGQEVSKNASQVAEEKKSSEVKLGKDQITEEKPKVDSKQTSKHEPQPASQPEDKREAVNAAKVEKDRKVENQTPTEAVKASAAPVLVVPTEEEIKAKLKEEIANNVAKQSTADEQSKNQQEQLVADTQEATEEKSQLSIRPTPENSFELILPASPEEASVKFTAKTGGEAWFGIYQDGKLVHTTQLKEGQTKDYKVSLPFRVTVGNRFQGEVVINGHPINIENNHKSVASSFLVLGD